MLTGLLAGAIAALIAAALSLPLHSPDDAFFNTATVALAGLIVGVAAGLLRGALHGPLASRTFAIAWSGLFVASLAAVAAGETLFERMLAFGAPLAAVVFGVSGAVVCVLAGRPLRLPAVVPASAAAAALAVGVALAGEGDAASGRLELPPAPSVAVPAPASTAAPTASATASAATNAPAAATPAPSGGVAGFTKPADLRGVTFVVGEGSEATFTVNEKVAQFPAPNDAVMRTSALSGSVLLDGRPSTVTLDLSRLSSDQRRRDDFIQQSLFRTGKTATFTVSALPPLPATYTPGQALKMTVPGSLNINGGDRPLAFEVEARIDGTTLNLVGRTSFVWADLGYRAPNTPTITVQDRVVVEVLLVARPAA